MQKFKSIDLNDKRKVYVVGDIHGMFSLLEDELHAIGFDKTQDMLISVGDLVDRGPESHLAARYAVQPWFTHIIGNHEQMTAEAGGTSWHISNGGRWFTEIDDKREFNRIINNAPVVLEVTRNGKKYGFVHADYPMSKTWADASDLAELNSEYLIWNRDRIERAKHDLIYRVKFKQKPENNQHKPIEGVDHVFFGHTPQDEITTIDNCTWLDTGAVFGWMFSSKDTSTSMSHRGKLSIVDLDDY